MPAKIQYEDEVCTAFNDIHPKDRVHILIVPNKHIATVAEMQEGDEKIMGHLVKIAKELAAEHKCPGYRLTFFVGKEGGQEVFHVHLHLIGK